MATAETSRHLLVDVHMSRVKVLDGMMPTRIDARIEHLA